LIKGWPEYRRWLLPGSFLRWIVVYGKWKNYIERAPDYNSLQKRIQEIRSVHYQEISFSNYFGNYYQLGWKRLNFDHRHFGAKVDALDFARFMTEHGYLILGIARQAPKDYFYWLQHIENGEPPGWNLLKPGEYFKKPEPTDKDGNAGKLSDSEGWDP
jgi:hypothetical protein